MYLSSTYFMVPYKLAKNISQYFETRHLYVQFFAKEKKNENWTLQFQCGNMYVYISCIEL